MRVQINKHQQKLLASAGVQVERLVEGLIIVPPSNMLILYGSVKNHYWNG